MKNKIYFLGFIALFLLFNIVNVNAVFITGCRDLNVSGTYTLINNINTNVDCFKITASNVIFNCAGHTVKSTAINKKGVYLINPALTNFTMKNCNISDFTWDVYTLFGGVSNLNWKIYDNDIGMMSLSTFTNNVHIYDNTIKNISTGTRVYNFMVTNNNIKTIRVDSSWTNISYHKNNITNRIFIDTAGGETNISFSNNIISNQSEIEIVINDAGNDKYMFSNNIMSNNSMDITQTQNNPALILNNSNIGNFWFNYSVNCIDSDKNGICDIPYLIFSGISDFIDYLPISSYMENFTIDLIFRDWDNGSLLTDDLTYICFFDYNTSIENCSWTTNGVYRNNWIIDNHDYMIEIQRPNYLEKIIYFTFNDKYKDTIYLKSLENGSFIAGNVYDINTGNKIIGAKIWIDCITCIPTEQYHYVTTTDVNGDYMLHAPECISYFLSPHKSSYFYDSLSIEYIYDEYVYGEWWQCNDITYMDTTYINFPMIKQETYCNVTFQVGFYDNDMNCISNDTKANNTKFYILGEQWGVNYNFTLNSSEKTVEIFCDTYDINIYNKDTQNYQILWDLNYNEAIQFCLTEKNLYNLSVKVINTDVTPLSGASVTMYAELPEYFYKTIITNNYGWANFTNLLNQNYLLSVSKTGFETGYDTFKMTENLVYEFMINPQIKLHGYVEDTTAFKNRLSGIKINLKNFKTNETIYRVSGIAGAYEFTNIPTGNYTIFIEDNLYHLHSENIEITNNTFKVISITNIYDNVEVTIKILGQHELIYNNEKSPMANTDITIECINIPSYTKNFITDNNGYVIMNIPAGQYNIIMYNDKYFYQNNEGISIQLFCVLYRYNINIIGESIQLEYLLVCSEEDLSQEGLDQNLNDVGNSLKEIIGKWGLMLGGLCLIVIFLFFGSMVFEFMDKIGGKK